MADILSKSFKHFRKKMRESIPRQVDKKSRVPKEEKEFLELSKRG